MKNQFMTFNDKLKSELRKFVQWNNCPEPVKQELRECMQILEMLNQAIANDDTQALMGMGFNMTLLFSRLSETAHHAYLYCESVVADSMGLDRDGYTG